MNRMTRNSFLRLTLAVLAASALSLAPGALAQDAAPQRFDAATASVIYGELIDALLPGLAQEDPVARQQPQRLLEQLCLHAGRPGAEASRAAFSRAICERLGDTTPQPARVWLIRRLEMIGGAECVATLTGLLADGDGEVRETARRALQHNPSAEAGAALRAALEKTQDDAWRIALINALAARGETESAAMLVACTKLSDDVSRAAVVALGRVGGEAATTRLRALADERNSPLRDEAALALVQCAEALTRAGETRGAAALLDELWSADLPVMARIAALQGLCKADPAAAVSRLTGVLTGDTPPELREAAIAALAETDGPEATGALCELLPKAAPEEKLMILAALARRGDDAAVPAVVAATREPHGQVREAAYRAMLHVNNRRMVEVLADGCVVGGEEGRAAFETLVKLSGADVDDDILFALREAEATKRIALYRALGERNCRRALPLLMAAVASPEESEPVAVMEAISKLGGADALPAMTRAFVLAGPEAVEEAENHLFALVSRLDGSQRVDLLLRHWPRQAPPWAMSALVRLVGRLGGERGLEWLRGVVQNAPAGPVREEAVRVLANWPEAAALDDLLELFRSSGDEKEQLLALRGFLRLLSQPSPREPAESLALIREAMERARRPEEQKMILSALGRVHTPEALELAERLVGLEELKAEALLALGSIVRGMAAWDRDEARPILDRLRAGAADEKLAATLDDLEAYMAGLDGKLTAWQYAGPYQQEGKSATALMDVVFEPEKADAPAELWKRLPVTSVTDPWKVELSKIAGLDGANRCVYVQSLVHSEREQAVMLEVGSDDGVRVWVNGQVVHTANVNRGHTPLSDKAPAKLKAGWNTILLKVTNASGGWEFSCGLSSAEPAVPTGLRYRAGP